MFSHRKIIHIDMDAFFASVEQRDNSELRGKPVAVGGNKDRGVVSAASYEARKFGVFSAMSSRVAMQKCPDLIFVKPNFDEYIKVSNQIREIFLSYTHLVEPLSIDEAFLDVTDNKINLPSATIIAKKIKQRIFLETGLTASAGVSYNKFLAKIASDYNKPNGFFLIKPEDAQDFIDELPVEKFFGIGKVTAEKMHKLNIYKGKDIRHLSKEYLAKKFGKSGLYYFDIAHGIDNRDVIPDREIKSVGAERTFENDIYNIQEIYSKIEQIAEKIVERCNKSKVFGYTLTLKVKYSDFKQITRSKTVEYKIDNFEKITKLAEELCCQVNFTNNPVRLIGLQISKLSDSETFVPFQMKFDF